MSTREGACSLAYSPQVCTGKWPTRRLIRIRADLLHKKSGRQYMLILSQSAMRSDLLISAMAQVRSLKSCRGETNFRGLQPVLDSRSSNR